MGSLLYFQTGESDLCCYNMELFIASFENGSNYEGEVIASGVESFFVD